ncbi:MAG: hypothetical protein Fur0032_14360 [Terrimicrobiaceae bacterium]
MNLYLLAADAVNGHPTFLHTLSYQTVGIAIVMTSLGGLAIIVSAVAAMLTPSGVKAGAKSPDSKPANVPPSGSGDQISEEMHAVIAAAVHVALGSTHRILHVEPVRNVQLQAWSVEGRRQIFHSHILRR